MKPPEKNIEWQRKDLVIILTAEEPFNYEIDESKIEKITVKKDLSVNNNALELKDHHTAEKQMLALSLAGILGSMLMEQVGGGSEDRTYKVAFNVEITYKVKKETKKMVILFSENPDKFFERYGNLYEKLD